jgi:hypothetical protein
MELTNILCKEELSYYLELEIKYADELARPHIVVFSLLAHFWFN